MRFMLLWSKVMLEAIPGHNRALVSIRFVTRLDWYLFDKIAIFDIYKIDHLCYYVLGQGSFADEAWAKSPLGG